jgi:hypothetical protein
MCGIERLSRSGIAEALDYAVVLSRQLLKAS